MQEITALEEQRLHQQQLERHIAFYLLLYSLLLYLGGALLLYQYFSPRDWLDRLFSAVPLVAFPILSVAALGSVRAHSTLLRLPSAQRAQVFPFLHALLGAQICG